MNSLPFAGTPNLSLLSRESLEQLVLASLERQQPIQPSDIEALLHPSTTHSDIPITLEEPFELVTVQRPLRELQSLHCLCRCSLTCRAHRWHGLVQPTRLSAHSSSSQVITFGVRDTYTSLVVPLRQMRHPRVAMDPAGAANTAQIATTSSSPITGRRAS